MDGEDEMQRWGVGGTSELRELCSQCEVALERSGLQNSVGLLLSHSTLNCFNSLASSKEKGVVHSPSPHYDTGLERITIQKTSGQDILPGCRTTFGMNMGMASGERSL